MNGNDDDIINRVRRALGRCFTRRCRRVRRALGYGNNHNSNNENAMPYVAEQTRKRRQSMTDEEIKAQYAAARLLKEKLEAEKKEYENRAYMNASRNHWAREAEEVAEAERRAREEKLKRERMEDERRKQEYAEARRRAIEEQLKRERERMQEERRKREANEARRAMEEEQRRKREANEARRKREEEEARKKRAAHPPPPNNDAAAECRNILLRQGIIEDPYENPRETQRHFRRWALQNHPDRGGDLATFQVVSNCFDIVIVPLLRGGRRKRTRKGTKKRANRA